MSGDGGGLDTGSAMNDFSPASTPTPTGAPLDGGAPVESVSPEAPPPRRARIALIKRLADVVSLPSSRVNAFERSMTSNLLVETLSGASLDERKRVALRVSTQTDLPPDLAAFLLQGEAEVASILLAETPLSDSDLVQCARLCTVEHRLAIVRRRDVAELVAEAALEFKEPVVIEAALKNAGVRLSARTLDLAVSLSRESPRLPPLLLRRHEIRPAQAYVMFWWCQPDERKTILQRFAVGREVVQEAASDVFGLAAAENWADPVVRKSLQFVERRQRNRAAVDRSAFESLEAAVIAAEAGLTRAIAREIGFLSGIKPATAAKILTDPTGEPLAVLCKATGLKRPALLSLWRGMRRPEATSSGETAPALERTTEIYDMMAVDRAQTVLRYWNWSLSSALTPALVLAMRDRDEGLENLTLPERSAVMALDLDRKA